MYLFFKCYLIEIIFFQIAYSDQFLLPRVCPRSSPTTPPLKLNAFLVFLFRKQVANKKIKTE